MRKQFAMLVNKLTCSQPTRDPPHTFELYTLEAIKSYNHSTKDHRKQKKTEKTCTDSMKKSYKPQTLTSIMYHEG